MGLSPTFIEEALLAKKYEEAKRYGASACIGCGCCSYVCPAKRYLAQSVKLAKKIIRERDLMAQISAYKVSASPHKTGKDTTRRLMLDVLIALRPASPRASCSTGCGRCCSSSSAWRPVCVRTALQPHPQKAVHLRLSALVTGLILGLNLPLARARGISRSSAACSRSSREDALRRAGQELCQPRRDGARGFCCSRTAA